MCIYIYTYIYIYCMRLGNLLIHPISFSKGSHPRKDAIMLPEHILQCPWASPHGGRPSRSWQASHANIHWAYVRISDPLFFKPIAQWRPWVQYQIPCVLRPGQPLVLAGDPWHGSVRLRCRARTIEMTAIHSLRMRNHDESMHIYIYIHISTSTVYVILCN